MAAKYFLNQTGLQHLIDKILYGISAPKYSAASTYALGAIVIYQGHLYKCTTAITVAEAWNAAHWTSTTAAVEIAAINTNLNDYVDGIDIRYNSTYSQAEWSVRGADTWSPFNNVELLWTNPNPTASFAAQTVALDLSKYDAVIIHASSGTSISVLNSYWCFGTIIRSAITQRIHSNDWAPDNRVVSMSDTGLVFQIGYNKDGTQSSGDKAKPIKIYGVRKFEPTFPS